MSFWKKLFRITKENSVLVKTLSLDYKDTNNITKESTTHKAFWHLHETESGRRYVNIYTGLNDFSIPLVDVTANSLKNWESLTMHRGDKRALNFLLTSTQWHEKIYPWLTGRRIPGIPSYSDAPKEDFKRALKEG